MKLNILTGIIILVAIISGCSNSNIIVKADETSNDNHNAISELDTTRQVTGDYNLSFPISQNPRILGQHHHGSMIGQLRGSISEYRRATGYYPESLPAYIESGFPLFWQRNLMNGLPMEILESRVVKNEPSDFGVVKWEKFDEGNARLTSSNIDIRKYKDTGEVSWIIDEESLKFIYLNDYQSMQGEEQHGFMREMSSMDLESVTTVVGGTVPINMVSDPDTRIVYAMCDQLHGFIFLNTDNYYSRNKYLPNSFVELLTFQQDLGWTPLLIKENINKFTKKLNDAGVEFKIGYDYANTLSYAFLKINGETLISHCYKYDNNPDNPNFNSMSEDESPGIHVGCLMDEIDMSSPMISTTNISTLDIPDEFFISVKDIPVV